MKRIILASKSPRRRELLSQTGLTFEVMAADVDEKAVIKSLEDQKSEREDYPALVVETLSGRKAQEAAKQVPEGIFIGADTIVWDHEILGKPKDRADAYRMLRQLQGHSHAVFTGVTVLLREGSKTKTHTFSCRTEVEVYPMTEQETQAYLDTGEPMDKAGAYGIQGKFGLWVKEIRGDYNNVVGLPLSALWQVLKPYV